jgi:ABC-type multidrug transport system ATPase subunit
MAILISMAPVAVASAEGLPWAALIPVALVAVAFVGYCLFDLRRASVRYLPKWAWALLCLVSIHIGVTRRRTALLPDTSQFEPWLTGREVVALARRLVAPDEPEESLDGVLRDAGLAEAASRRVCGYSRGMLQRLGLAATVVGRPELLLLDEPASALDPAGRREVLDLISRLRGHATVVLSSHILADVQEVCDAVGILRAGRLLYQGPLETLLGDGLVPRTGSGYVRRLSQWRTRYRRKTG